MLSDLQQTVHKICISMGLEKLFLLCLSTVALSHAFPTVEPESASLQDGYVENGRCKVASRSVKLIMFFHGSLQISFNFFQDSSVCTYRFTVSQQFFQGDLFQNYTLSAIVRVDCNSGEPRGRRLVAICRLLKRLRPGPRFLVKKCA